MKQAALKWLERHLSSYTLVSDTLRMVVAAILASITNMLLFALVDLTSWVPEEAQPREVSIFVSYFIFCVCYFLLCHFTFGKLSHGELQTSLRKTKPEYQNPLWAFLYGESGTSHATMFSVIALMVVGAIAIRPGESGNQTILQVSALLTVLGSWMSNTASFALQFAREDAESEEPGFRFPDGIDPIWSDYLYSAVMISATLSTADVEVVSRSRRKLVIVNTIIAFTFNTVIIAMLIAAIM